MRESYSVVSFCPFAYKYACNHTQIYTDIMQLHLSKFHQGGKQLPFICLYKASKVWSSENVIFVCASERPGVNVTVWSTAGTILELSVSQAGCLLRPRFLPDLCVMILIRISEPHLSPLCNHSVLLIWFLITIYGGCCSVALTWGRRKPQGLHFTIEVMMEVRAGN